MRWVHTAKLALLLCWPLAAWASSFTLGSTFGALTWIDIFVVIFLSVLSGSIAMLQRVEREKLSAVPVRLAITHVGVSLLAGVMAFFFAEAIDMGAMQEALTICGASWGGVVVIDKLSALVTRPFGGPPQ